MHVEQSLNSDSNIKDTKFLLPCPGLKIPVEVSNNVEVCVMEVKYQYTSA